MCAVIVRHKLDAAVILFRELPYQCQTQTAALRPRGKKRLENFFSNLRYNAGAIVFYGNYELRMRNGCSDFNFTLAVHRLDGIAQKIEQKTAQLPFIGHGPGIVRHVYAPRDIGMQVLQLSVQIVDDRQNLYPLALAGARPP